MPSRSEPASPRKLRRARELGDVPHSPQLSQAAVLCVAFGIAPAWIHDFSEHVKGLLRVTLLSQRPDLATVRVQTNSALELFVRTSIPIVALTITANIAVRVIEARVPGSAPLAASGVRDSARFRFFRKPTNAGTILATSASWLIAACLIGTAWGWFRQNVVLLVVTLGQPWSGIRLLDATVIRFLGFSCALWATVGALGCAASYFLWLRRNRMTRHEKQLEEREMHGDPSLIAARKALRGQLMTESTHWTLNDGTILVVNPGYEAAVLYYEPVETSAPRLTGVARANTLRLILNEAHLRGTAVFEAPELATALCRGVLHEPIPVSHYEAVAELFTRALQKAECS